MCMVVDVCQAADIIAALFRVAFVQGRDFDNYIADRMASFCSGTPIRNRR
jgi:hypothetical protein